MGGGRWSTDVYALAEKDRRSGRTRAFAYSAATMSDPSGPSVHATLDPKGLNRRGERIRESCDSEEHPESLAIAVFFDVTGSMRTIPQTLQKKLPQLLGLLLRKGYVDHPQLLFGAIGDATCENVPLQVGQFESNNRMDDNLDHLVLEGGGGGQKTESYELALYFVAEHTATHCWEKRRHKGYLFVIGDEMAYPAVRRTHIKKIIGDDVAEDIPTGAIVERVQERYEVFYLLPKTASHGRDPEVLGFWRKLLGQNVLELDDPDTVCETIALTIGICEGRTDLDEGVDDLKDVGVTDAAVLTSISRTLANLPATAVATAGGGLAGLVPTEDPSGTPPSTIRRL